MFNDPASSSSATSQTNSPIRTLGSIVVKPMTEIISKALPNLRTLTDQTVVLIVGISKSGKSTLINYLLGTKFYATRGPGGRKIAELGTGETLHAPMSSSLDSVTLTPCAYEKDGIVYCDTPGFDDNREREKRICAIGCTQAGISLLKAIQTLVVVIDVTALYGDPNAFYLETLAYHLSQIIKIEKFPFNMLFALTKSEGYMLEDIMEMIKMHIDRLSRQSQIASDSIEKLKNDNASYPDIEERRKEAEKILHCLAVLSHINVHNSFIMNVFDSGESRSRLEQALKTQQALPGIVRDQFNFGAISAEWQKFENVIRDMAQPLTQALIKRMDLPRVLYEKNAENDTITQRLKVIEKRILALKEGQPASLSALKELREKNEGHILHYQKECQDLQNEHNEIERKIKNIKDAGPTLYRPLEWQAKDATIRTLELAIWTTVFLGAAGVVGVAGVQLLAAKAAAASATAAAVQAAQQSLKAAAATGSRESISQLSNALAEIAAKITAATAAGVAVGAAETTTITTVKAAAVAGAGAVTGAVTGVGSALFTYFYGYEHLLTYDDIVYEYVIEKPKNGTLQRIEPEYGILREETKYVPASATGHYSAIFKGENNDAGVTVEFYVLSKNSPKNILLINNLQEEIISIQKKIVDSENEIKLLTKINANTSEIEMLEAEKAGRIEVQTQLNKDIPVLSKELQTIKQEIQNNEGLYEVLKQIVALFSSIFIRQFVAAYDRYDQFTSEERENDLFLAMEKFYISPETIDWSQAAHRLGGDTTEVYKRLYKTKEEETWVAVKQFSAEQLTEEMLHEAELMMRFKHPNIIKFCGITKTRQAPVYYALVMECMTCSLYDVLYDNKILDDKLPVEWRIQIASQIIDAIIYLHEAWVLHCDIKSLNILLSENQQIAKLTDFGISKSMSVNAVINDAGGSWYWLAPEMSKTGATKATDIFALGIVIAEIVNRKLPFEGQELSYHQYRDKIQAGLLVFSDKFPILSSLGRDCIKLTPGERPNAEDCKTRLAVNSKITNN